MRLMFVVSSFPLALFVQANNKETTCDAAINLILEISSNYLERKNYSCLTQKIELNSKNNSIDWNDTKIIKWQIIKPKDK